MEDMKTRCIMIKRKRYFLLISIIIVSIFSLWFIILDFSRFISLDYSYDIPPSAVLKRINVVLAAIICWSVGRDGIDPKDSRRMKAAFVFIILGEAAFNIGERAIGIGMFALCQTLLIIRNSTGLRYKWVKAGFKQKRKLFIPSLIIITSAIIPFLYDYLFKPDNIFLIVYIYGIILSISLWTGHACSILGLLPKVNSRMAASGVTCFFCCDVLVGLDAVLEAGLPWLLANSFIWIFYIPALVLLALSCYRYN
jgi:hypothetical protein